MPGAGAFVLCVAPLLLSPETAISQDAADLRIEPAEVSVGLFYDGTDIRVTGEAPSGDGLALVVAGEESTVHLKTKGRVAGLFWMNVGEVTFERVPSFYRVIGSADLATLAPPEALDRVGAGYDSLAARSAPGAEGSRRKYFAEFLKLKEREGLFGVSGGGIRIERGRYGRSSFSCVVRLPALALEGTYRFTLIGFRSGKGEILAVKTLGLHEVGAAECMRSLAREHGLLYGIIAVVTALAAGLLTGFLFDLRSKERHRRSS